MTSDRKAVITNLIETNTLMYTDEQLAAMLTQQEMNRDSMQAQLDEINEQITVIRSIIAGRKAVTK